MAFRGAKSVAEYMIRRWLAEQPLLDASAFKLTMAGDEAYLLDRDGRTLSVAYDNDAKEVYVKGVG